MVSQVTSIEVLAVVPLQLIHSPQTTHSISHKLSVAYTLYYRKIFGG